MASTKITVCTASFLLYVVSFVKADYQCVCNYNIEKPVYPTSDENGAPIGYVYEFDCKPKETATANPGWYPVAFEHQLGFILQDAQVEVQTCPGSPPQEDKLTTSKHTTNVHTTPVHTKHTRTTTTTTTTTTTPLPTTTTTTTTTTTPMPTTTSTTTTTTTPTPTTTTTTTARPTTTTTTPKPTTTTTTPTPTTTTTTPKPTTTTTTPRPTTTSTTTTTTTPQPTTTTTTPTPTTTSTTTTTTTPRPTTTTTTTTTPRPTTTTTLPTTPVTHAPLHSCLDLYERITHIDNGTIFAYGGNCYELVKLKTIWAQAEIDCRSKGGHLAHIANSGEQNLLYQFIRLKYHHPIWIGLHDRTVENDFHWTSGDRLTYTNWYPGSRDTATRDDQDCVAMDEGIYMGQWEDVSCTEKTFGFVCQFALEGSDVAPLVG